MKNINKFFQNIKRWIAYRTYDKYYVVNTGLSPRYYDKDKILLHANFNLLKDFVECELANMNCVCGDDKTLWKKWKKNPEIWGRIFGTVYLNWECDLRYNDNYEEDPNGELSSQAIYARVIRKCYLFWVDQYLQIPNLWQMCDEGKITGDQAGNIQRFWENLADRRLSQLMKVRQGLWT